MLERNFVLITGAAERIGRQIATSFAASGYGVILHTRSRENEAQALCEKLVKEHHVPAYALIAPLATCEDAQQLVELAQARIDRQVQYMMTARLRGIVANASMFEYDRIEDGTDRDLMGSHLEANFVVPLYMLRRFRSICEAKGYQAWFTALADQKIWNTNPDYFSYTISKSAFVGGLKPMAVAAAPHVRVNVVAPGLTLPSGEQTDEQFASVHANTPLQRGSTPEDVSAACVYLAQAPSVMGQVIFTDGGQRFVPSHRDVMFSEQRSG